MPTIQQMSAADGVVRGNVESLMKLAAGRTSASFELMLQRAASRAMQRP